MTMALFSKVQAFSAQHALAKQYMAAWLGEDDFGLLMPALTNSQCYLRVVYMR